jgi:hypothetical protein
MKNRVDFFEKAVAYSLYLFAFLLPWQTRMILRPGELNGGYIEYLTISIYLSDFLLIFALSTGFVLYSYKKAENRQDKEKKIFGGQPVWLILAGLEIFVFISIFFAEYKLLAIYRYTVLLLGFGLFWLLTEIKYDKLKLLYFFLAGAFFQSLLAIWQFINQASFSNKYLGISGHDPADLGTSVVEAMGNIGFWERWLRAYGGLDHPNILGGFLVFSIIICLYLILFKNLQTFKGRMGLLTLYVVIGFLFTAVFFSFSRSAWLSLFFSLFSILFFFVYKKDWESLLSLVKPILVGFFIFILLAIAYKNIFLARIKSENRLEKNSNIERLVSLKRGKEIAKDNIFTGTGVGNYVLALKEKEPDKPAWFFQPAHNSFLLIMSEIGIFGAISFIVLFFYLMIKKLSFFKEDKREFLLFILPLSMIIIMLFDHWIWSLHFGIFLMFFIFGIMVCNYKKNDA